MGRPKGSKNKIVVQNEGVTTVPVVVEENKESAPKVIEVVKEIIVEKIVEKKPLSGFALFTELKRCGFPQGGVGSWQENPNGIDKVYIPHISEVYGQFISDPSGWDKLRDAMCRVWIDKNKK